MNSLNTFFVILLIALLTSLFAVKEAFYGMSPGTLTQLESTHVPSAAEVRYFNMPYSRESGGIGMAEVLTLFLIIGVTVVATVTIMRN